ncbi:MAG: hypothetical protein U0232_24760 [Thermomicrobiales bacterium]
MKLALLVAPQRSTMYGNLARTLAVPELLASPLAAHLRDWERANLGGQDWLLVDLNDDITDAELDLLWLFGTLAGVYEYFPSVGDVAGPLLRPVQPLAPEFVPASMIETRRYRGKTNEMFTTVLLNLALFASDFALNANSHLRILDPLMGGGTTLFVSLVRGYDAIGIDREKDDFDTTNAFVIQFFKELHVPSKRVEERVKGSGRRALFTVGTKGATRLFGLVHGDTYDTPELLVNLPGGARFHAIVADLPYGIQHQGQIVRFLEAGLPRWASVLRPGGALALAWEASGPKRQEAITLVERHQGLSVINTPPYDALEHQVDRQIRRRDVLVIRKD